MKLFSRGAGYLLLLPAILAVSACKREKLDLDKLKQDWNPTMAVPLIDTKLGVYNIFAAGDSSQLVTNSSGLLGIVYRGELLSIPAGDIASLPDQFFINEIKLNPSETSTLISNGTVTKIENTVHDYIPIPTQGYLEIDSLRLATGSFKFEAENSYPFPGTLTVKMPSLKKGNASLQTSISINANSNVVHTVDISGYSVGMSTGPGNFNKIPVIYELRLNYNGNPPSGFQSVVVKRDLLNWKFERFFGYIGQHDILPEKDSIQVEIFNNAFGGYFAATNPKVTMEFVNSFGFPINLNLTDMHMRNNYSNAKSPFFTNFPNNYAISHPSMAQVGSSVKSQFTINKNNSNIDSLVNSTPKYLVYGFSGHTNPGGASAGRNFMTAQSRFTINTELELPLEGFAYGLGISDTLDFSFAENRDEIEWVEFRITIENRFPVDLNMQLIFLDKNYNKLDSLIPGNENLVNSAMVDNTGRVSAATKKVTLVKFDQDRVPNLLNAKYVLVRGLANTYKAQSGNPANPSVRFYTDYDLVVKAGVRINSRPASGI